MAVYDDGTGPALYVGGNFDLAAGMQVNNIARWDGMGWLSLGSGLSDPFAAGVSALAPFATAYGRALYVAGYFSEAGGVAADCIAAWDGSHWSAVAHAVFPPGVDALCLFEDGGGPALYAAGSFLLVDGTASVGIAKWHCAPDGILGDMNCDGRVNEFDIDPFVLALVDPAGYSKAFPKCHVENADCNEDGVLNAFDIDPFIDLLAQP